MKISYEELRKLFSVDLEERFCIEILFSVQDEMDFSECWMGKMPNKDQKGKNVYWFGLTPDGKQGYDYNTFADMSNAAVFKGKRLCDILDKIDILEIDGCDPEARLLHYFTNPIT